MATDKQIAANRRNAEKCTGPKTVEGKAASSQNALKTGLHAKSDVIATENRDDYDTLISEYYDRFHPTTPEERCLVDDLIRSEWLGRRYMAASTAIWEYELREMKEQDMGLAFMRHSEALGRAQRCITANQRNYAHALKQLQAIQSKRPAQPEPAAIENEPFTGELVSFPQSGIPPQPGSQQSAQNDRQEAEQEEIPPIAA